jgi:PAS domain S-box-containing protein
MKAVPYDENSRSGDPESLAARLARAEARARDVEERYALATSAALEGIYEWFIDPGLLVLSERARQCFALAGDKLTPAAWNARIHPEDFAGYRAAIVAHFKGHARHLEHEYRIRDAEGGYRWILDRGVGVRGAGDRVTRVVGALSDINDRKLAEIRRACRTSCERRSTPSSDSRRFFRSGCSATSTTSRRNTSTTSWRPGAISCR